MILSETLLGFFFIDKQRRRVWLGANSEECAFLWSDFQNIRNL